MGQLFVQTLLAQGVEEVTLSGLSEDKLKLNHDKFGAKTINTAKGEKIPNDTYDIVIEAVGRPETQEQAVEAAARGGQVLMFGVGNPDDKFSINSYEVFQKQLTIQGAFINPYCFEDAIALMGSGKVDVLPLLSHEFDLKEVDDFVNGRIDGVSKAVVKLAREEA